MFRVSRSLLASASAASPEGTVDDIVTGGNKESKGVLEKLRKRILFGE